MGMGLTNCWQKVLWEQLGFELFELGYEACILPHLPNTEEERVFQAE